MNFSLQRMRKRKRNDIAWQYCTVVDNNVGRVRCNFCGHVMWGGVTRLKHHLACIKGNVIPCRSCPPGVTAEIQEYLGQSSQNHEENIDGGRKQVNHMRGTGNEKQLQQEREFWSRFVARTAEYLTNGSHANYGYIGGGKQVNDMRGRKNQEQFLPEQECWPMYVSENGENLTHYSPKNEERTDGIGEQVNDMRSGGSERDQEYWPKSVENLIYYPRKNKEKTDGVSEQLNDMRTGGTEEQLRLDKECWPMFGIENGENLTHWSQKKGENIDGVRELVNDMRIGNQGQLWPDQSYRPMFVSEIKEYLTHRSLKNEENIDGVSELVNYMRIGNKGQLRPDQVYRPMFDSEIGEFLTHHSQKNEEHIDGVGELVNDMRGEGQEEQLQPTQECWQKSASDDLFKYSSKEMFRHGWEDRFLELTMESQQKNHEDAVTVGATQHDSSIAFWYDRIPRGEDSSGTKPVLSYREFGMTGDDSDSDSDLGF